MSVADNTPVLIGVGEASERIDAPDYEALSPVALASKAAAAALADAGAAGLGLHIDVIAAIRQFEVSGPNAKPPFGASDNFARSVGQRIGADPARAILEVVGGQGPQHLVNEMAHAIARGEAQMALLVGSESISTVRHLVTRGETRDWAESVGGQLEDRGFGDPMMTRDLALQGARTPIQVYALFENARRARLGMDRAAYGLEMGRLFAPFTKVAHDNPHAMSREVYSADELATVTGPNRLTADPFPRRMVARDQANQGAAVLLTSVGKARELGVPEDRWVYLHGGADVRERTVMERQDFSRSPASALAVRRALEGAGIGIGDLSFFDLYSCFPIAVFNICDAFGLAANDPRGLTLTGGLPFFGGAGNNYSMHAIASMVRALRGKPGSSGLVGANGGFLSKYSVGVYSTKPTEWRGFDSAPLQREVDGWEAPALAPAYAGELAVETYTIDYSGPAPRAVVIGRTAADERVPAGTDDAALVGRLIAEEPLGGRVTVAAPVEGRTSITAFSPPP
ncbi:MAG TPA: acetyl-CoA acetyltransferase [Caulobacteraceae bacterium]|jgi:acetyl-CoA C-acetyltransferase|nr:acetyl-CoA acetyltransferase [Caulobacteraceae bacterium]